MPNSPDKQSKYRVQLDFSAAAFEELEALKRETGAGTRANTVRYAMQILQWVINQFHDGADILIQKDGKLSGVVFPFLPMRSQEPPRIDLRVLQEQGLQEKDLQEKEEKWWTEQAKPLVEDLLRIGGEPAKEQAREYIRTEVERFQEQGRWEAAADLERKYAELKAAHASTAHLRSEAR